ncbi:MAG: hypothetical protein RCH30_3040 [Candidatus Phytoplasma australasiaticum]|nr:hypothetical protein EPWB_v2c2840 ['Echinacea purpurea' witches'-broom phytoplasma]WEX20458.1 MAG: hypothetical protein TB2022_3790 [Candidatus Phytoplasma aurantifolia]WKV64135.1 MAG: hypothetical protein NCHU2022_c2850 [Candidatus Phytoplasma australasiaticum]WMW50190.1 MAG: hypothetical protein RCH30_3040 [Candidatus Phytoplasma australasiaticum]
MYGMFLGTYCLSILILILLILSIIFLSLRIFELIINFICTIKDIIKKRNKITLLFIILFIIWLMVCFWLFIKCVNNYVFF